MKKNQIIQLFAIAIVIVFALIIWSVVFYNPSSPADNANNPPADNTVIRKIGNFELTQARIQVEIDNMHRFGYQAEEGSSATEVEIYEKRLREQAISNLTDFYIVLHYAKKNNLDTITDEQIEERISGILAQADMNLIGYLTEAGIAEEDFRDQVRGQLVFERVLDPLSSKVPEPTEEELTEHFSQNKEAYVMPETVEYQQIVVPDMATCTKVIGLLNSGRTFADVVQDYSQNNATIESGGLMPIMSKDDIPIPEVSNALFPPYDGYEKAAKINVPIYVETESVGIFILNLLYRNPSQSPGLDGSIKIHDSSEGEMNELPIRDKVYSDWKAKKNMELGKEFVSDLYEEYASEIVDLTN